MTGGLHGARADLALVFGGRELLQAPGVFAEVRAAFPGAALVLGSSSGEIVNDRVGDEELAITAVALARSSVSCAAVTVRSQHDSFAAGRELAHHLRAPDLVHVLAISDGQLVNGTELSRGFNESLPPGVTLTGGLAGDGSRFEKTVVGLDEIPVSGRIVAVGFYGRELHVGFGSCGGWEPAGGDRTVTRANGNILFTLDDQPALRLYREHLGREAEGLPAAALRHPICVAPPGNGASVVRTILSIEDVTQSMVFAGDVPPGSRVRFMQASHDALVDGARQAAKAARLDGGTQLAICVSCVGRRIVLSDRVGDEVAGVRQVLDPTTVLTGFYSYGELAPAGGAMGCQLHNQTMTITTFREASG